MSSEGIREFGTEEEEWNVECSDEERYEGCGDKNTDWTPKPEEIVRLLNVINETGMVELAWKCPGRRSPSPPTEEAHPRHDKAAITEENKPITEFDFDDLLTETSSTKITPRRTPRSTNPKGSGQRRVGSFENVMCDIRRQMRLEQLDKTPAKSGSATKTRKTHSMEKGRRRSPGADVKTNGKLNSSA